MIRHGWRILLVDGRMLGWKTALCSTLGLDGPKQTGIGSGKPMDLTYYMSDDLEIRKSNGSVLKLKGLVSKNKLLWPI